MKSATFPSSLKPIQKAPQKAVQNGAPKAIQNDVQKAIQNDATKAIQKCSCDDPKSWAKLKSIQKTKPIQICDFSLYLPFIEFVLYRFLYMYLYRIITSRSCTKNLYKQHPKKLYKMVPKKLYKMVPKKLYKMVSKKLYKNAAQVRAGSRYP